MEQFKSGLWSGFGCLSFMDQPEHIEVRLECTGDSAKGKCTLLNPKGNRREFRIDVTIRDKESEPSFDAKVIVDAYNCGSLGLVKHISYKSNFHGQLLDKSSSAHLLGSNSDGDILSLYSPEDEEALKECTTMNEGSHESKEVYHHQLELRGKMDECIRKLEQIHKDLDESHHSVTVSRITGSGVGIAGGAAMIGGGILTFLSGGLAAPLLGMGLVASVGGTVTSTTANYIGSKLSDKWLEEAEKSFKVEERHYEELSIKCQKLYSICKKQVAHLKGGECKKCFHISLMNLNEEHLFSAHLKSAANAGQLSFANTLRLCHGMTLWSEAGASKLLIETSEGLLVNVLGKCATGAGARALQSVSGRAAARTLAKGAAGVVGGAVAVGLDIHELVTAIKDRGPTVAMGLVKDKINLLTGIRDKLNKSIKHIASGFDLKTCLDEWAEGEGELSEDNLKQVLRDNLPTVYNHYRHQIGTIHSLADKMLTAFQEELERPKKCSKRHIDFVFVSHGNIEPQENSIPKFFMPDPLNAIHFYSPWGCGIDYSVSVGIITDTIDLSTSKFELLKWSNESNAYVIIDDNLKIPDTPNYPNVITKYDEKSMKKTKRMKKNLLPEVVLSKFGEDDRLRKEGTIQFWKKAYAKSIRLTSDFIPQRRVVVFYEDWFKEVKISQSIVCLALYFISLILNIDVTYHHGGCLEADSHFDRDYAKKLHEDYFFIPSKQNEVTNMHVKIAKEFRDMVPDTIEQPHPDSDEEL